MSNELAIVAVTLTLRDLLGAYFALEDDNLPDSLGLQSEIKVTTLPPQKLGSDNAGNQVNLFLYAANINAAWRNHDMPVTRPGEAGFPPLALNLEYLLSAYGEGDSEVLSHVLLGHAMRVLHDNPIIPRALIQLPESGLPQQIERVTVTQRPTSIDEMSKLWSSFVAPYRVSTAYLVTVVLIESRRPPRSALPVLRRGQADRGPVATTTPPPSIVKLRPPRPYTSARLGDDVVIRGHHLAGDIAARIRHPRLEAPIDIVPERVDGEELVLHIPDDAAAAGTWICGVSTLSLLIARPPLPLWTTNELPLPLAPSIKVTGSTDANTNETTVIVTCVPEVRAGQTVLLLFGDQQVAPVAPLEFRLQAAPGTYVIRLRVDGVDSIPAIRNPDTNALEFDPDQMVTVP